MLFALGRFALKLDTTSSSRSLLMKINIPNQMREYSIQLGIFQLNWIGGMDEEIRMRKRKQQERKRMTEKKVKWIMVKWSTQTNRRKNIPQQLCTDWILQIIFLISLLLLLLPMLLPPPSLPPPPPSLLTHGALLSNSKINRKVFMRKE